MNSPTRRRSPCQRYNKQTQKCNNCNSLNNKVPFEKCVKYNEYKGNDILLELIWRVYQQVRCVDIECREPYQTGHRFWIIHLFRQLKEEYNDNVFNVINNAFITTFSVYEAEYLFEWLKVELKDEYKIVINVEEIYDYNDVVNKFELLEDEEPEFKIIEYEEEHEFKTPNIKKGKKRTPRRSREQQPQPTTIIEVEEEETEEEFNQRIIRNDIITDVYESIIKDLTFESSVEEGIKSLKNHPKDLLFVIVYCSNIIRQHRAGNIDMYNKIQKKYYKKNLNVRQSLMKYKEGKQNVFTLAIYEVSSYMMSSVMEIVHNVDLKTSIDICVKVKRVFNKYYMGTLKLLPRNELNDIYTKIINDNFDNLDEFGRTFLFKLATIGLIEKDIEWAIENAPYLIVDKYQFIMP